MAPRGQTALTRAPPVSRFPTVTLPLVRSIKVLAMKKPSPMPSCLSRSSSAADLGLAQRMMARARGDIGLANPLKNLGRKTGTVIFDRDPQIDVIPAQMHRDL